MKKLIEINYFAFLLFMPFLIPAAWNLSFLPNLIGISSVFLVLGIIIIFVDNVLSNRKIFFDRMIIFCFFALIVSTISSVLMSILIYKSLKLDSSLTTLSVTKKQIIINVYSFLIILYNYEMFQRVKISKILKLFKVESLALLIISTLQLIVIIIPSFSPIYDIINFHKLFSSSEYLISNKRITGFGYEPSFFALFAVFISLPLFLHDFIYKNKTNIIYVLWLIFLSFFTKS